MTDLLHPQLAAHGSFGHLKLGRKPHHDDKRTLQLARYLDMAALPAIPAQVDYTAGVGTWPMYGNDRLGDCTCAAVGHMIQAWSHAVGGAKTPADGDIEDLYWQTGYPPSSSGSAGGATDDGRDEQDVLSYWRQNGVGGDKIAAFAFVDPSDLDLVRAAIWLFGGVYTGIELPLTAQGQQVWDVEPATPDRNEPGSWGGHAVPYEAYDPDGFTCITWGAPLKLTSAFHNEYTDELYAVVSPDWLAQSGVDVHGFDLERLEADLAEITQE